MDRRERQPYPEEMIRMALRTAQARIWTALPGIVQAFHNSPPKMTVDVQPTLNGVVTSPLGVPSPLQMPKLLDCPVLWQGGGGVTATFPIKAGDECLVIFSSRCIDAWWAQGGVQNQSDIRMHNLSDGFALVGVRSLPRAYAVDTANACLISDDGTTYFKLNPTTQAIKALAPGGLNLNGVLIDVSGNVTVPGEITTTNDDLLVGGISLKNHVHSGVQPGGGDTGPPV
jgi:hypothetical protein